VGTAKVGAGTDVVVSGKAVVRQWDHRVEKTIKGQQGDLVVSNVSVLQRGRYVVKGMKVSAVQLQHARARQRVLRLLRRNTS